MICLSGKDHGLYFVSQFILVILCVLRLINELLKHLIFSPAELDIFPVHPLNSDLDENEEVKDYVQEENRCPPNRELIFQVKENFDQNKVEQEDASHNELDVRLNNEIVAVIESCKNNHLQEMSGKENSDTFLNSFMGSSSHGESQNAKHELDEPHAEPVEIFLHIVEVILCPSLVT